MDKGLIEKKFANIKDSILIIGAENDERAPVTTNAKHYHKLIKNSEYIELKGNIGHYIFMNEAKNRLKRSAPFIFQDKKNINRDSIHKKIFKIVIEYFKKELKR